MSWWGGVAGALGSIGSSALSLWNTGKQHERNKEMAKYVGENAHQWEVNDLRNAGLNPILSSGGSGNAGGASPTSFVTPDFGQSINSGRMAAAQSKLFAEQQQTEKDRQNLLKSEAEKNKWQAHLNFEQASLVSAQNTAQRLNNEVLDRNTRFQLSGYGDAMYGLGMFTGSAGQLIGKFPSMK